MKIYSALGVELLDLIVDDKSYRYKVIMDENTMTLYFNMPDFHEIPEGSYCDYKNERYFLLDPENFKQINSRNFEYTLVLDSFQALTKQVKYKFFTMNGNTVDSPFELKFSLTATPSEFAQLLINNMNVWDADGGWSVGECIESDPVCIDFNHDWCYDVLPKVSDAFKTEWEFENKTLHIRKVEKMKESPIPLKYGYDCGLLPGVSRSNASNAKIITRLFIEGGDRNIDKSTYGSSALRMPKNHTITYMGIDYKTDATGTYIERVTPLGRLKEGSLDVTKIYPKRIGTISAVNVVNADTNLYDIIDSSIPGTLDFSALVIAGETMTIIFQTGQLAGKEFEVKYKSADKRFELVPLSENGLNYPSGSIVPEIGDKYAVFNISLPTDYITSAETDVLNDAVKYLWENEQPKYTGTGTLDAIYAKRNWLAIGGFLNCGYFVSLTSDEFLPTPIDIRIVAVKEYINKPKEPEITLSNEVSGKTLGSELNKTSTQEQAINRKDAEVVRFARRQFSDIKQTTEMLQSALLNFSSSISPLTVQTMQLIAGDETLQFVFVANSNSVAAVAHNEIYNPTTKQFISAAGVLQHKTLGVTTLSSAHAATELKWWNMTAFVSAVLDDSSKSYYLYAKVSKTANTGVFLLSETAIALESVAGYYHLLMGILNSENDGDRSYSQFYGYSELTPARMTVKKVVSPSGNTFFDLENEVIQGNIKFQSGVTVETGISNAKSEAVQLAYNDATAKVNNLQIGGENLVDDSSYENGRSIQTYGVTPSGTVSVDTSIFFDGSKSMKHTFTRNASNEPCGIYTINSQYDFLDKIKGKQIVHSIYVKASGSAIGRTIVPYLYFGATDKYGDNFTLDGSWQQIWMTAIVPTNSTVFLSYIFGNFTSGDIINVDCVFVGFGNKVTDWKLSKKDIDAFTIAKANAAYLDAKNYADAVGADKQAQIDGQIISWFRQVDALLTNSPASDWTTETLRNQHANDTYTNTSNGKCWRYQYNGSTSQWEWGVIADTATQQALAAAGNATTIANGKRTVFDSQPNTPYLAADLWLNNGDLYKCTTARSSGSFISGDWDKAVKYTDDTAVNNLVIGGRNYFLKSDFKTTDCVNVYINCTLSVLDSCVRIQSSNSYSYLSPYSIALKKTDIVTVSFDYRRNNSNAGTIHLTPNGNGYAKIIEVNTQEWNRAIATFKSEDFSAGASLASVNFEFYDTSGSAIIVDMSLRNLKLELGNKATDYTKADEDITAAILIAKQAADTAQTSATTANGAISSLNTYVDGSFKDGVISTSEAQAIEKYKNQVTKDFNDLIAGYNVVYANSYLVGSAKTDLLNAKVTMSGAKDNLLTSINNAIADGKTTVSEKADVDSKYSTWDSSYSTYKSKLELANKAIQSNLDSLAQTAASNAQTTATAVANTAQGTANAAQNSANSANTAIANLKIGGRNYVPNSVISSKTGWSIANNISYLEVENSNELRIKGGVNGYVYTPSFHTSIPITETITLSFLVKNNAATPTVMVISGNGNGSLSWCSLTANQGWTKYVFTALISTATGNPLARLLIENYPTATFDISIKQVKLEIGTRATDYTEDPEDDYVKKAIKGSASINGGLVLGNVMAVTDENGNVMAGMNGLAGAQYPIWSGAADAANANFSVDKYGNIKANGGAVLANGAISYNSDGTGQIGNGAMTWDALKRLIVNMTNFKIDVNGNVSVYGNLLQQSTSFAIDSLSKSLSVTNFAYRCQRVYGYHASPAVFTLSFPAGIVNGTRFSMYINNRIVVDGSGTNVSVSSYLLVNSNINLIYKNGVNGGQGNIIIAANSMAILEGVYVSDSLGIGTNTPSFVLGTMTVMTF